MAIWPRAGVPGPTIDGAMEPPTSDTGKLVETSKRFARRLLTFGGNGLELLMVEMQEERERLLHAILLALGVVALCLPGRNGAHTGATIWVAFRAYGEKKQQK